MDRLDVKKFRAALLGWYHTHQRSLPWRDTCDPYRIWVSEVMLQQTQVKTVIPYFNRFINRFPTVGSLAAADLQEVLKLWEGLGYYSRARNLHRAVIQLLDGGKTEIPGTPEDFLKLPGVGDYTCAAVQSIAFNHPFPVVDGNVKRVLSRLFELTIPVNDSSVHTEFKKRAAQLLDKRDPSRFNQAMMELGALVCRPSLPICSHCPVQLFCRALRNNTQSTFPKRKQKKTVPQRHYSAGAVVHQEKILIVKRKTNGFLGGMWEFPGKSLQKNTTPEQACIQGIRHSTGLSVSIINKVTRIRHAYTHFKLILDLFLCESNSDRVTLNGPDGFQWISLTEIDSFPFHKAVHKCFPELEKILDKSY